MTSSWSLFTDLQYANFSYSWISFIYKISQNAVRGQPLMRVQYENITSLEATRTGRRGAGSELHCGHTWQTVEG